MRVRRMRTMDEFSVRPGCLTGRAPAGETPDLQGNVAVLPRRVLDALVLERREAVDQHLARVLGADHGVDEAELRRAVRVRERPAVLLDELGLLRDRVLRRL